MRLAPLPLGILLAVATGCSAHSTMYGTVVMRLNETEAHVCLQEGSVVAGDRVQLVRHVCDSPTEGRTAARQCHPSVVGEGVVESLLNEHYSLVRFPAELAVREGDTVQPVAH